jgi:hypothetical protein
MSQQQKRQQEPAFYNRKVSPAAAFREGLEDAALHAFLMQLPLPPAESASEPVFELDENTETEPPKPPPVNGALLYGGGVGKELALALNSKEPLITNDVQWPTTDISRRKLIIIMPLKNGIEFMAFGVCTPGAPPNDKNLFVFAARGTIGEQLDSFIARLMLAVNTVEAVDVPSEPFLKTYLEENAPELLPYPVPSLAIKVFSAFLLPMRRTLALRVAGGSRSGEATRYLETSGA